jgi:hypothetical protein
VKILVAIPCLYGAEHTKEAIDSVVYKQDVSVLLIDNGAEVRVKELLSRYEHLQNVFIIHNKENNFVNAAWQQAIDFFNLWDAYSHLIIMNSDLIMQSDWDEVCINRWLKKPDEILIPVITDSKLLTSRVALSICQAQLVHEGTPGVFITINRKQAKIISPLPTETKVWFGDNWIYEILRGCGYETVIPSNLISYHYWSANVQKVEGISAIIEKDKEQWELIKHRKDAIIELHKLT